MSSYIRFVTALILCLVLIRLYSVYKVQAAPVLPGVMIGGHDFRHAETAEDIAASLRSRVEQPVLALFNHERIPLSAEEAGLQVDTERILAEATAYLEGDTFLRTVLRRVLGLPEEQYHVPLYYRFDRAQTQAWLEELDHRYRVAPQSYQLLPVAQDWLAAHLEGDYALHELGFMALPYPDWTWQAGAPGIRVDVEASLDTVAQAFIGPGERVWSLATMEERGPGPTYAYLADVLDDFTSNFAGFVSFYLQDLTTQDIAEFDSAVAFSGMSTMKLLIVMAVMRDIEGIESAPDLGQWIDLALGDSNNAAANLLLHALGNGNVIRGAATVTDFARQLGLQNTFILTGYDDRSLVTPLTTPANSQQEWNTRPDTHLQTTAADMGRILAGIWECTQGRGLFIETFPQEIQPEECMSILFYLAHNDFQEMLWGGLPERGQRFVLHKHGFTHEQHGDVALIWGPAGPYVLSLYLYRRDWLDWATSNSTMYNVSRIAWRFHEHLAAHEGRTFMAPMELQPPAGYIPQPYSTE